MRALLLAAALATAVPAQTASPARLDAEVDGLDRRIADLGAIDVRRGPSEGWRPARTRVHSRNG